MHIGATYDQICNNTHVNYCQFTIIPAWFSYPFSENHVPVVEYLIKNPDTYPNQRDTFGVTPLHFACRLVCTGLWHSRYITQSSDHNTLFLIQLRKGSLNVVKCLIEERLVNPNSKNNQGETPLHLACRSAHNYLSTLFFLLTQ